jgi:GT2 family glycosyltransferase
MKLSVIIVNYKSGALTRACIESLLQHRTAAKTEIIVVDNGSGDDSVQLLRADFPDITIIDNEYNRGLAAGVNAGIARAQGQYYLILNPDIIVLPGAVESLLHFMDTHPRTGLAGGKLLSPNGRLQYSCYRFYRWSTIFFRRTILGRTTAGQRALHWFLMKDFNHASARAVDWLMGACLIVRAQAVKQVGGMDERFFLYFEDVDWCRRFWHAGWQVMYVPQARLSHYHQRSSDKTPWLGVIFNSAVRHHLASAAKYFWKYRHTPLPASHR